MASARALNADSALDTRNKTVSVSANFDRTKKAKRAIETSSLVMVILASQYIHMQRYTRSHGKRVENVRQHFRRQVADLFAFELEVSDAIGAAGDVDDCS